MAETWSNGDGVDLACYCWPVEESKRRFVLYLCHGYAEHARRYGKVVEEINKIGGSVYGHDHYGHGESGPHQKGSPKRYEVADFSHAARDLESRIQVAREENPKLPVILYGHSMGGLIAIMATIRSPDLVNGLILEAAAIKIHPSSGAWWQIMAAKLLSRIAPNLKVGDIDKRLISRDPDTIQSIIEDENCATNGGVSAGFAVRLLTAQAYVIEKMNTITVKTLIASGTNDQLTCKSGSDLAAEKITTNTYKLYDGAYHQLHAERGDITKQYISDVMEWIENVL